MGAQDYVVASEGGLPAFASVPAGGTRLLRVLPSGGTDSRVPAAKWRLSAANSSSPNPSWPARKAPAHLPAGVFHSPWPAVGGDLKRGSEKNFDNAIGIRRISLV